MRLRLAMLAAAVSVGAVSTTAATGGTRAVPGPPPWHPAPAPELSWLARQAVATGGDRLERDSLRRRTERETLRVRNVSCVGIATGSAFAIDAHTIVTNRHVLEGADAIQLSTWDGRSLTANVTSARMGRLVDIGFAKVSEPLPAVVRFGPPPRPGDPVTAVGFPLGGPMTRAPGRVVRYRDGRRLSEGIAYGGRVMQVSTPVKHGNSGGPLLDARGRVVGVIFAGEPGRTERSPARTAYAIPAGEMRSLIARGGEAPVVPTCAD